jgi:hypothetical protein
MMGYKWELHPYKSHKRLIIKQIAKRFGIKKGENTERIWIGLNKEE